MIGAVVIASVLNNEFIPAIRVGERGNSGITFALNRETLDKIRVFEEEGIEECKKFVVSHCSPFLANISNILMCLLTSESLVGFLTENTTNFFIGNIHCAIEEVVEISTLLMDGSVDVFEVGVSEVRDHSLYPEHRIVTEGVHAEVRMVVARGVNL